MTRALLSEALFLATICVAGPGCSTQRAASTTDAEAGFYSSSPSKTDDGPDFDAVLPSVRMLSSVGFYRRAEFSSPRDWPIDKPIDEEIWDRADTITTFTEAVVGTGTILQYSRSRIALLTSAHVVTFDDTVTTYYRDKTGATGLRSVAVKVRQKNYVADIMGADELEVLALDDRLDVALVGQIIESPPFDQPTLRARVGTARDLAWGSFVYAVGFPVGLRMISTGIVSQPGRDRDESFLTDVVFNRGMSGGIVLASRTGQKDLEWVGILTSGSASTENVLVPDPTELHDGPEAGEPYEGDIYLQHVQRIRYGVTIGVSVDAIKAFLEEHRGRLLRRGYRLSLFE